MDKDWQTQTGSTQKGKARNRRCI